MNTRAWRIAAVATRLSPWLLRIPPRSRPVATGGRQGPKAQGEALRPDSITPGVKDLGALRYQDRVATAIVREPQNTWSNLGFVFVGALIVAHDRRVLSRFLGTALTALGIASDLSRLPPCVLAHGGRHRQWVG